MFYDLLNIYEIDLTKLDTSKITTMNAMFHGCISLTSLIFGNIIILQLKIWANYLDVAGW